MDGSNNNINLAARDCPLLFEILKSFSTLASTLNLSHAVRELGSTRQTVRRHISQLEEIKGGELFAVTDRQYELTDLGHKVLPEALDLLARAEAWLTGSSQLIDGMQYLYQSTDSGWFYYQQQHPLGRAFDSTSDMLPSCIRGWSEAKGDIEHEAMKLIRPKCMIFRRSDGNWLFTEVGEESSIMSWFGWAMARSSVGRPLGQMPGGARFGHLINEAYLQVEQSQAMRLDHCYTILKNDARKGPPANIRS